jgi:hypothetical protein
LREVIKRYPGLIRTASKGKENLKEGIPCSKQAKRTNLI